MSDPARPDGPEDEMREMLQRFLAGEGDIDPSKLAGAAGLPSDPASVARLMSQLQAAMNASGDGVNWDLARDQAVQIASRGMVPSIEDEKEALRRALGLAALWLGEATQIGELAGEPRLLSRAEWARETLPVWSQLAEPVANSIADALTRVLQENLPEGMDGMMAGAGKMMRGLGGTLFAMQLGHVVGQLSGEVVSGGDAGIPLLDGQAALLPQNVLEFGRDLGVEVEEVRLYLSVRELAHARLFRHARWLRLHLITAITEYAHGITIDTERLEQLAEGFDPTNTEELQRALSDGRLIPPKSEEQLVALGRLETMLALVEGWVDVVTEQAAQRLPAAGAIAETVRRRRASGGPAESAFATLVGLELRPRRLREAAAMWRAVQDAVGAEGRDELWAHPDVVPTAADIDDPAALVARLTGPAPEPDEFDRALEDLLNGDADGPATPNGDDEGRPQP
ncbi:zinc-dependent metalloprotease [Arenivirga flava]|nr:zinc-dependent metalloprotease [Arenivirga flava]